MSPRLIAGTFLAGVGSALGTVAVTTIAGDVPLLGRLGIGLLVAAIVGPSVAARVASWPADGERNL